jgi:hypothetical protein
MESPLTDAVLAADRALRDGATGKLELSEVIEALRALGSWLGVYRARGCPVGGYETDWHQEVDELVQSLRAAARDGALAEMFSHGREILRPLVEPIRAEIEGELCR